MSTEKASSDDLGDESLPAYRRIQIHMDNLEDSISKIDNLRRRIEGGPSEDIHAKTRGPEMSLNDTLQSAPGDLCSLTDRLDIYVADLEKTLFS